MKILFLLSICLSSSYISTAQNDPQSLLKTISYIAHWIDHAGDFFNSVSDKHKREEAVDRLTYLKNDIDVLYTNENSVISVISMNDSATLVHQHKIWEEKARSMLQSLGKIIADLRNIQPLLNATLNSQTDSVVNAVDMYLGYRKAITLSEIEEYLSGHSKISKSAVLADGHKGLNLLLVCKAKLSSIIDKLNSH